MTATYRLQMHAGFTFSDARAQVGYLADLGVTHLYLSPVLQSVRGSMHGYDVVDHNRVSDELGGETGLLELAEEARQHRLGLIVDVVPNHMAMAAPEHQSAPLWDVFTHGRQAEHAHWFDIDWDALDGKIGLPILGSTLAETLEKGEITLGTFRGRPVVRYYEHMLPLAEGTAPASPEQADLAAILAAQHYLLAGWQEKDAVLNYRRFFDVDSLIAVRVEEADVFEATHRLLLDLNRIGVIEGFRIDHPDGLADPQGYLARLRAHAKPGTAVWVEKILEGDEALPGEWACEGTTGYDGLKAVTAALVDLTTGPTITEAWTSTGGSADLEEVEQEAKRLIVTEILTPEHHRLVRRAREVLPDADPDRLGAALTELLVAGEVYRAYVEPGSPPNELARARIDTAVQTAVARTPDLAAELGQLGELAGGERDEQAARDFAVRFQQTWGPVMAKGIEDTTFYRWHRLVALNEVGGNPALLDNASPEQMHAWADYQQEHWPLGMLALSTHDTKRSEDVRARIIAVAGDAESWQWCSTAFARAADEHDVDRQTGHLLWQTLVGVGDIEPDRLHGYLEKAMREAKQHTTWIEQDPDYEARVHALADFALTDRSLTGLVTATLERNADAIRAAILGQKLLQLTLPGIPDTYQGTELVDLSLVDPDNRRPVDYADRRRRLAALAETPPADLDDEKLLVTTKALAVRRDERSCFGDDSTYRPIISPTRHAVGFVRSGGPKEQVAVLVTRAPHRLEASGGWGSATVTLDDCYWLDELTGTTHLGPDVPCAEIFASFPVALLRRIEL